MPTPREIFNLDESDFYEKTAQIQSTVPVARYTKQCNQHNFVYGTPGIIHGITGGLSVILSYKNLTRIVNEIELSIHNYIKVSTGSEIEILRRDDMNKYVQISRLTVNGQILDFSENPLVSITVPDTENHSLEKRNLKIKTKSWFKTLTKYMKQFETETEGVCMEVTEVAQEYFTGEIDSYSITVPYDVSENFTETVAVPYAVWLKHSNSYFHPCQKWALNKDEYWMVKVPTSTKYEIKQLLLGDEFSLSRAVENKTYGADYYTNDNVLSLL